MARSRLAGTVLAMLFTALLPVMPAQAEHMGYALYDGGAHPVVLTSTTWELQDITYGGIMPGAGGEVTAAGVQGLVTSTLSSCLWRGDQGTGSVTVQPSGRTYSLTGVEVEGSANGLLMEMHGHWSLPDGTFGVFAAVGYIDGGYHDCDIFFDGWAFGEGEDPQAVVDFLLDQIPENQPPGAPTLVAPPPGHTFVGGAPQVFTVQASDPDQHPYRGVVTVSPAGGGSSTTFTLALAASDGQSSGTPPTPLAVGGYTWTAVACDVGGLCGPSSGPQGFTVAPAPNGPPNTPSLKSPADGATLSPLGAQTFTISASDAELDDWTGTIRLKSAAGAVLQTLTTPSTESGLDASANASPNLPVGSYKWDAQACETATPAKCSAVSTERTFTVVNQPPGTPSQESPASGHDFLITATQSFTVRATDPEGDAWTGTVELRPIGGGTTSLSTASTASGASASVSKSPSYPPGEYEWRAKACQTNDASRCSAFTGWRPFTVLENQAPGVPVQNAPADGEAFLDGEAQTFTVTATDPEGDSYFAQVVITPAGGGGATTLTTPTVASGSAASVGASPPFADGAYTWKARACETVSKCGGYSAERAFTVGRTAPPGNRPPDPPVWIKPTNGDIFEFGETQEFVVRANDPDGDPYSGLITFRTLDNQPGHSQVRLTTTPSGMRASGRPSEPLQPGTYVATAFIRDLWDAPASSSVTFGVAAFGSFPCSASVPVVDGWFGDRYLQIATAEAGEVGYVCLKTAQGGEEFAGWLRAETGGGLVGGGVSAGTTAACPDGGEGNLPFPLLDQTVGPNAAQTHLWSALRRSGAALTACFKLRVAGNNLLDHAVSITAPEGAELSKFDFVPVAPSAWSPPAEIAPPAGLPSSECFEAAGGRTRFVNADVEGQRVWLYAQQDTTARRLCARIEGEDSRGVVLREHAGAVGQPMVWQVGLPVDHATSPCHPEWEWYASNAPYHARLRTSAPDGDPLAVCISAGLTGPTLAAWVATERNPNTAVTSHAIDP